MINGTTYLHIQLCTQTTSLLAKIKEFEGIYNLSTRMGVLFYARRQRRRRAGGGWGLAGRALGGCDRVVSTGWDGVVSMGWDGGR